MANAVPEIGRFWEAVYVYQGRRFGVWTWNGREVILLALDGERPHFVSLAFEEFDRLACREEGTNGEAT